MEAEDNGPVLSISLRGDFDLFIRSGGWNLQDFMRYETFRLKSFHGTSLQTSPLTLASCGFYVTRFGDEIRCYSCGVRHRGDQIPARPASTQHGGGCLHERQMDPRNVVFGPCRLPQIFGQDVPDPSPPHTGHLLWKINNYKQRRQAAFRDDFNFVESPPFYTARGYKMCARIYLNGRGVGVSGNVRHAVVLFVIMSGERDACLTWPFRQRVTLSLLNQGRGENISSSFTPDPSSSVFNRPVTRKVVFGSSLVVDLRDLELPTKGFLLNDSIVINVKVND